MINPWKVLGVHRKSSDAEIRDAFYAKAKKHHPDLGGTTSEFGRYSAAYALIETAKERRKFLDKLLADECGKCKGAGTMSKSKGLTGKVHTACNGCGGAGLLIKEDGNDEGIIELRGTSSTSSKRRYKKR